MNTRELYTACYSLCRYNEYTPEEYHDDFIWALNGYPTEIRDAAWHSFCTRSRQFTGFRKSHKQDYFNYRKSLSPQGKRHE